MLKYSSFRTAVAITLALCAMVVSPFASADCCPSDGNGAPKKGSSGLGEAFPVAPDLVADAAWQVYEFERDGIRYIQVNDHYGIVRAAVGRIDGTFWVLPIGADADRVSIPGDKAPIGEAKALYRSNEVEVLFYRDASGDRWIVRAREAQ
jgi:hypothetical protein